MPHRNPKNRLQELLAALGLPAGAARYEHTSPPWASTCTVTFPDGVTITGHGEAPRKITADIAAARDALDQIRARHPARAVDWEELRRNAQLGDAVLKLAVYLDGPSSTVEARSRVLQEAESDAKLATVFDRWRQEGDPDVSWWGPVLGSEAKATIVEALIWRRFGASFVHEDASAQAPILLAALTAPLGDTHGSGVSATEACQGALSHTSARAE